jgi:hypothetical protein
MVNPNSIQRQLPDNIRVGDLTFAGGEITHTSGDIELNSSGSNVIIKSGGSYPLDIGQDNSGDWNIINKESGKNINFVVNDGGNYNKSMTLDNSGRVGIGTDIPTNELQVNGVVRINTSLAVRAPTPNGIDIAIGDNDTGFKQQGDGELAIYTNIQERMRIDSGGNVGIGTNSPTKLFHIRNGATGGNTISFQESNLNTSETVWMSHGKALSTYNSSAIGFTYEGAGSTNNRLNLGFFDSGEKMVIKGDGNVGIGTTNPSYKLDVNGTGHITGTTVLDGNVGIGTTNPSAKLHIKGSDTMLILENTSNTQRNTLLFKTTTNEWEIGARDSNASTPNTFYIYKEGYRFIINSSGNVGIGTSNPSYKLDIGQTGTLRVGTLYLYSEGQGVSTQPNSLRLFGLNASGGIAFDVYNADDAMYIKTGGNVGIGTTNPSYKLDVNGTGHITGTTVLDGNVGIGTTNPTSKLHIYQNSGGNNGIIFQNPDNGYNWLICNNSNNDFVFRYNGADKGWISNIGNVSAIDFTGQHRCLMNENTSNVQVGLIVSSSNKYINIDNSVNTNINESLPYCILTNVDNDKKVFGVISDKEDNNDSRSYSTGNFVSFYEKTNSNEQRIYINSLGEGAIWVCNKNGNLINGDYISSSSVSGYGMKQTLNESILSNHTVAKITCDCDFSLIKIVKKKLNTVEVITVESRDKKVSVEKTREETKIEYDENTGRYIQKTITENYTEEETVYDEVDLYDEQGNIIGRHKVAQQEEYNITKQNIVYDSQGDPEFVDDLDEEGNQQMVYPLDTRFLLADGTILADEEEYNTRLGNGEEVYIACFVGCTYHCG